MNTNWYIFADNQNYGPFTYVDLQNMVSSRQIVPETMLYHAQLGQWTPAVSVNGLGFQQGPPVINQQPPPLNQQPPNIDQRPPALSPKPPAYTQNPPKKKRGCCLPITVALAVILLISSLVIFLDFGPNKVHNLILKKKTILVKNNISTEGGSVQVSDEGSVVNGLTIDIPAGAYKELTKFTVSTREISSHDFGEHFYPVTPLITIENGGDYAEKAVTISIPINIRDDEFALAFYYTDTGLLEALPLIYQDSEKLIVATKHFSDIVVSSIKNSELENLELDTGFQPGIDDWSFANYGSQVSTGGHCAGQTASMAYYYYEKRLQGAGPLHTVYDNNHQSFKTPKFDRDDSMGIRLASVVQADGKWSSYYFDSVLEYIHKKAYVSDSQIYKSFGYAMLLTGDPQLMGIFERNANAGEEIEIQAGHAILAYKLTKNKIAVCDPNYPGNTGLFVPFNRGRLGPYRSTTSVDQPGTNYNSFSLVAKSALFDWESVGDLFTEIEKPAAESTIGDTKFSQYTYEVVVDHEDGDAEIAVKPELVILDDLAKGRIREAWKSTINNLPEDWETQDYLCVKCKASVEAGAVNVFIGTKSIQYFMLEPREYLFLTIPLHKGMNDIGLFFQAEREIRDPHTNQTGTTYDFIDFVRFQVQNGEEDISGTWKGHIQIEDLSNTVAYAESVAEGLTTWLFTVFLKAFMDKPPSKEEIRQAVKENVTVNQAALEPMPLTVTFEKNEGDDQYAAAVTLTVPSETGSQSTEIHTQATYQAGKITFNVPYEDGSIMMYKLFLNDHNTASGEFDVNAGALLSAFNGTCELAR